jgi:hypothetical protein
VTTFSVVVVVPEESPFVVVVVVESEPPFVVVVDESVPPPQAAKPKVIISIKISSVCLK